MNARSGGQATIIIIKATITHTSAAVGPTSRITTGFGCMQASVRARCCGSRKARVRVGCAAWTSAS